MSSSPSTTSSSPTSSDKPPTPPPQFSDADSAELFQTANLSPLKRWQDPEGLYSLWLLERPGGDAKLRVKGGSVNEGTKADMETETEMEGKLGFPDPLIPSATLQNGTGTGTTTTPQQQNHQLGNFAIPTPAEWKTMWSVWDKITLGMIPGEMLHQKPIDLRHRCLFYLGHIPA